MDKAREARLKKYCDAINAAVPKAAMTYIGSEEREPLERFSTGSASLDEACGGGWPIGRIVELYGSESSGKTTLCYHAIAEFQKKYPDLDICWVDSEYSFDPDYASKLGVNVEQVLIQQPESGEDAFNVLKHLLIQGVKLIVVDSVAALTPRAELEKNIGERTIGEAARLASSGLKQIVAEASRHDAIVIFTNQMRDKIGVMYGDKSTTPGGRALKFYASIRVDVRAIGTEKEGEEVVSIKVKAMCKKNKTAPPMRDANFVITFGVGIDNVAEIFDLAVKYGIVEKSGGWFDYEGTRLAQGRASCLEVFRQDKAKFDKLRERVESISQGNKTEEEVLADMETSNRKEAEKAEETKPDAEKSDNPDSGAIVPKKRGRPRKVAIVEPTAEPKPEAETTSETSETTEETPNSVAPQEEVAVEEA